MVKVSEIFSNGDGDVINGWIVVVIRFIDIGDVDGDGGHRSRNHRPRWRRG